MTTYLDEFKQLLQKIGDQSGETIYWRIMADIHSYIHKLIMEHSLQMAGDKNERI